MGQDETYTLVVPCYNEAQRLPLDAFIEHLEHDQRCRFLFVNDGSSDATETVLQTLVARGPDRMRLLTLAQNQGKAEAVRHGLLAELEQPSSAAFIGYWDADLATPLSAAPAMLQLLRDRPALEVVLGSRVQLLGRQIERRRIRHYLGRVFATFASLVLHLPVYDTQCGAKMFRATPRLREILREPFQARWIFDVELLARWVLSTSDTSQAIAAGIYELPLDAWRDIAGSKVRFKDLPRAAVDLWRVRQRYGSRLRAQSTL